MMFEEFSIIKYLKQYYTEYFSMGSSTDVYITISSQEMIAN